jgi:hypothetical protein
VSKEQIRDVINVINGFMMKKMPKYRKEYELQRVPLFSSKNVAKLIELFFDWLTNKKYLCHRVRIN